MMRTHLDQTLDEAVQRLEGDHEAEIRTYDESTTTSSRWPTC